jgi:hypothetical protein
MIKQVIGPVDIHEGKQHREYVFHWCKAPSGIRFFAGHKNGLVLFELAQIKIGTDKVQVLIEL